MYFRTIILSGLAALALTVSCSTTRALQEGEYRLAHNRVSVIGDDTFNTGEITPYIKQQTAAPQLSEIVGIKKPKPVVYDASLVTESEENIARHLEYLGYYGSTVNGEVSVKKRNVTVQYDVTLGKRYPVSKITYVLPSRGEFAECFLSDTVNVLVRPGDFLSEKLLEKESERSSAVLREKGFFGFNKNYYFFVADTLARTDSAALEYRINEYTRNETPEAARMFRRYTFGDVTISHDKDLRFREKVLREMNTVVPGDPYRESTVNETYRRLSSLKVFSGVNMNLEPRDSSLVDCSISLTRSALQGFKFNIEASTTSNGLFGISPQLTYYNKNIFHGGEWLNFSVMTNNQFMINDNVRADEYGVSASLSFPKLVAIPRRWRGRGTGDRTEVSARYSYTDRPEYTRHMVSASFGYSGNWGTHTFYQIYPMQLNLVKLVNIDPYFLLSILDNPFLFNTYMDHLDLGSRFGLYYTTDVSPNPRSTYHYVRCQVDLAGNVLSLFNGLMKTDEWGSHLFFGTAYSQYVRTEVTFGKTWRLGRNGARAIATRVMAGIGYSYGNQTALPFEKQFYGGGANSLRGWQARSVGPGLAPYEDSFVIPSQTGDFKMEANVEYRFPLVWKLAGALFLDAGNVWYLKADDLYEDDPGVFRWNTFGDSIAANWGMGLRLDIGFLVLRIDGGMRLHDPARQGTYKWVGPRQWFSRNSFALHFGVGYPF